ncbi:MAG: aminotransferase class IV [Planctomycetes bacterium]|nr:aminotransferase class IV family protein [Planctomycetota bacterium]MCB9824925.1 aminotransferase class IV [Planctomycetota bacterium]MCB9902194.1 aminotransferase class IV [Planctomycetota bacterium]
MEACVSVNGVVTRPEDARVPALDRGFLYGDSVYEVLWWHRGAPIQLEEHLERLERSAERMYLDLGASRAHWRSVISETVAASGAGADEDVYVRLVVTRGVGALGLSMEPAPTPTVVVVVAPARRPAPGYALALAIVARERVGRRALDPAAKTGNYMNNALALHEAKLAGADDAVLLNAEGFVTEASTANVYLVERGALVTPALDAGLLEGTTRRRLLGLARELGVDVHETAVRPERLRGADEVFVSSSVRGVVPASRVDQRVFEAPLPGPVTSRLREAFEQRADEEARARRAAQAPSS